MSTSYTPSTTTFHSTITVVSDGDAVNALDNNAAPQQVADNAAYLQTKISPLISGGTIAPSGALTITSAISLTGNATLGSGSTTTTINGGSALVNAPAKFTQRPREPIGFVAGNVGGSTYSYTFESYDLVYVPSGTTVTAGTTWKLGVSTAPINGTQYSETLTFRNFGSGSSILIKDSAGTNLASLDPFGFGRYGVSVAYDSGSSSYVLVDQQFYVA